MKIVITAVVCILLGFGAAYLLLPAASNGDAPAKTENVQQYTCGMHPEIVTNEPGLCPICHMKLIPKRDASTAEGAVRIDPTTRQNMGLVTAVAKHASLSRAIHAFGEVAVPDPNLYRVTVKFNGWVEHLFVAEEGKLVHQGQPLLEVYSPELVTAQKELLVALKSESSTAMTGLAEAARNRLSNWDVSDDQIEQLVKSGEVQRTLIIRSPVDGFVQAKKISAGDRVTAQSVLYQIADLRKVWIKAAVYETDLPYLQLHQTAQVTVPSLPDRMFEGHVSYIAPLLNEKGQVEIRLDLDNPSYALKPAVYAEVSLQNALAGDRLVIPRSAVINSGVRRIVYVTRDDQSYEPRAIVTGVVGDDDMIEVVEGLSAGDSVVTSGQFLLDSETRLSEAVNSSSGHIHESAMHAEPAGHVSPPEEAEQKKQADDPYNIYTCPMPSHYHVLHYGPGTCPECGMDLVPVSETDNAPIYVCPMPECGTVTKEPGVCPVCNMKLKLYRPEAKRDH